MSKLPRTPSGSGIPSPGSGLHPPGILALKQNRSLGPLHKLQSANHEANVHSSQTDGYATNHLNGSISSAHFQSGASPPLDSGSQNNTAPSTPTSLLKESVPRRSSFSLLAPSASSSIHSPTKRANLPKLSQSSTATVRNSNRNSNSSCDEPNSSNRNSVSSNSSTGISAPRPSLLGSRSTQIMPTPKSSRSSNILKRPTTSKPPPIPPVPPLPVSTSMTNTSSFKVGDRVTVDAMGVTGTLRFLGPTGFKPGTWAGVELDTVGAGKNDGTVNGTSYFKCPPQTGLFVLGTKLSKPKEPAHHENHSSRPSSPQNRPPSAGSSDSSDTASITPGSAAHHAALAVARITAGSRASRYLNMTASQLAQRPLNKPSPTTPSKSLSNRSNSPTTRYSIPAPNRISPPPAKPISRPSASSTVSGSSASPPPVYGLRHPLPMSPALNDRKNQQRRISASSSSSVASHAGTGIVNSSSGGDGGVTSPSPKSPETVQHRFANSPALRLSTPSLMPTPSSSSTTTLPKSPPPLNPAVTVAVVPVSVLDEEAHFSRLLGGAVEAPDEAAMKMERLQIKIEVLEAENRFLKLENAQNKSAEKVLERSLLLASKRTDSRDASHYADAIRSQWDEEKESWVAERAKLSAGLKDVQKEKEVAEKKIVELEQRVVVAEANAAAAAAVAMERIRPETRQSMLDEEAESVHEKVLNMTEVLREKDRALREFAVQIEELKEDLEEKELTMKKIRDEVEAECEQKKQEKETEKAAANDREAATVGAEEAEKFKEEMLNMKSQFEGQKNELLNEVGKLLEEKERMENQYKVKITELEAAVDELKKAGMESIELYETTVEVHKADMETLRASLGDEKRKTKSLESDCEELRKASVEAIGVYKGTIEEVKRDKEEAIKEKKAEIDNMHKEIDGLKKEIDEIVKASKVGKEEEVGKIRMVWQSEKKRLEERLENLRKEVESEYEEKEKMKEEYDRVKEEVKELEKLKSDQVKLEEKLKILENNYEEHLNARTRLTEDVRIAKEEKKKAEGDCRRAADAKEKADKELKEVKEKLDTAQAQIVKVKEQVQQQQQQESAATEKASAELQSQLVLVRSQHDQQIETLQGEIERLDAHNKMVLKQKEELALKVAQLESTIVTSGRMSPVVTVSSPKEGRRTKELTEQVTAYEEQIGHMKHLIQELKKDNETMHAENKKLMGEYDKLIDAHKQVENECLKLMEEVERLHSEGLIGLGGGQLGAEPSTEGGSSDQQLEAAPAAKLTALLAEKQTQMDRMGVQHAAELREIRQKYAELEKMKLREINALNKDVAELESLVESKIFHEADLEEAVESEKKQVKKLREEVQELKQQLRELSEGAVFGSVADRRRSGSRGSESLHKLVNGKNSGISASGIGRGPPSVINSSSQPPKDIDEEDEESNKLYCEICEEHGHDIMGCKAMFGGGRSSPKPNRRSGTRSLAMQMMKLDSERPYCENCEEFGLHYTDDCPNQDETF